MRRSHSRNSDGMDDQARSRASSYIEYHHSFYFCFFIGISLNVVGQGDSFHLSSALLLNTSRTTSVEYPCGKGDGVWVCDLLYYILFHLNMISGIIRVFVVAHGVVDLYHMG